MNNSLRRRLLRLERSTPAPRQQSDTPTDLFERIDRLAGYLASRRAGGPVPRPAGVTTEQLARIGTIVVQRSCARRWRFAGRGRAKIRRMRRGCGSWWGD